MDDILSSGNIFAIAALAAGALALLKKHWYRWTQVLFTVAIALANAKVLRWAYTASPTKSLAALLSMRLRRLLRTF